MALVGIHRDDDVALRGHRRRLAQAVADGGAQSLILLVAVDDQREIAAVLFQNLMGPVGAAIVHHDDGKPQVFVGQALEDAAQQIADVGLFVVGRENHDNAGNPVWRKRRPDYLWR